MKSILRRVFAALVVFVSSRAFADAPLAPYRLNDNPQKEYIVDCLKQLIMRDTPSPAVENHFFFWRGPAKGNDLIFWREGALLMFTGIDPYPDGDLPLDGVWAMRIPGAKAIDLRDKSQYGSDNPNDVSFLPRRSEVNVQLAHCVLDGEMVTLSRRAVGEKVFWYVATSAPSTFLKSGGPDVVHPVTQIVGQSSQIVAQCVLH